MILFSLLLVFCLFVWDFIFPLVTMIGRRGDPRLDPVHPVPADLRGLCPQARPRALLHPIEVRPPGGDDPDETEPDDPHRPVDEGRQAASPALGRDVHGGIEIRRFGYGHRRPEGPAGSRGVQAARDPRRRRGTISELAFARKAVIEPHTNPNLAWFIVIEGGGFVRVGEETVRVFAGEAVKWPAERRPRRVHGRVGDARARRRAGRRRRCPARDRRRGGPGAGRRPGREGRGRTRRRSAGRRATTPRKASRV